jgi:thioesterase domain-containing protein
VDYIRKLKAVLPCGPYALAGFSFGGVVAWEMASRLMADGDTVELLGLFDTHNPEVPLKQRPWKGRLRSYWAQGSGLGWGEKFTRLAGRMADGLATHRRVKRELREAAGMAGTAPHSELRRVQVREAHYRAMLAYEPADYAGRVVLFKAIEESDKYDLPWDYHWSRRARALEIHPVPGRHLTLFDKNNVGELARVLRCCLQSTSPTPNE